MSKNPTDAPRIGTRAKNAQTHPGLDNTAPKRKRRTKAEMAADKVRETAEKEQKELKQKGQLKKVAETEERISQDNSKNVTPRPPQAPQAPLGAPLGRTERHMLLKPDAKYGRGDHEIFEGTNNDGPADSESNALTDFSADETASEDTPRPKKKTAREEINAARKEISSSKTPVGGPGQPASGGGHGSDQGPAGSNDGKKAEVPSRLGFFFTNLCAKCSRSTKPPCSTGLFIVIRSPKKRLKAL